MSCSGTISQVSTNIERDTKKNGAWDLSSCFGTHFTCVLGEDPVQFIPMLQSDGTLRNFPKQLLWVYSIRTRDKQVIVQPSALSKWNQQPANQILNPSSRETETEHEKEINNNDTSVPNLASQSALSSQRKSKICTICFKVVKFVFE